jgi:hypothetical protein
MLFTNRKQSLNLAITYVLFAVPLVLAGDSTPKSAVSDRGPYVRSASDFPGADIGEQINAAYADLPDAGGVIYLAQGGSFSTPIVFATADKPVLLVGLPGDIITLTYTGTDGTAITFDYGTGHRMGHGFRDLTVTGPGNSTNTIGVMFGGNNGAEGIAFRDFKIQSFGKNLLMGSHAWIAYFEHGMIRDGGNNVLLPAGLTEAGEQIVFNHVTFADAPSPHRDSVWVQGGGPEVVFSDCSFDQAQLRVGNGSAAAAQIVVKGTHFENPNYQVQGSMPYDYVVIDNHPGNLVRITDSYFLQDAPFRGPSRFLTVNGGRVIVSGVGMYTPAGSPLKNFAVLGGNAKAETYGFTDLSGNITGPQFGH